MVPILEEEFEHELEVFRTEVQSGTQYYYAFLAIHAELHDDREARKKANETPLFWNTLLHSLYTSFYISLGRIFDAKSTHSVYKLLRLAQNNMEIFSKEALAERKRRDIPTQEEWLRVYVERAYAPTHKDFRRLRRYVKKYRKTYEKNYEDIRNKVIAHKELSRVEDIQALTSKTRVDELERLFVFLNKLYEALLGMYHNGHKPVLRSMPYSLRCIRKKERCKYMSIRVHEMIVNEAREFFSLFVGRE